jgi:queuine tRNA-ribosyltransferase
MHFTIDHRDINTKARTGKLSLPHGDVQTPVFIPVGTQAAVKSLTSRDLEDLGTQMILGNTYHLFLRPGCEVIEKAGGLHSFIGWPKPILTDSGGYQVYSLADLRKVNNDGVHFRSHIDGMEFSFTPEKVVAIQEALGVDIMMQLDECPSTNSNKTQIETAVNRTFHWAQRSLAAWSRSESLLFGIVQGGLHTDLRQQSVEKIIELNLPGYALGGFSVGEEMKDAYPVIKLTATFMPEDRPRYLMGVGFPEDIVTAVGFGIDMFDCVLPTRCARTGLCFFSEGRLRIKNACHKDDLTPIDPLCQCYTCKHFSRAYIRHLFLAKEITATILMTIHNIHYYLRLCQDIREAIQQDKFQQFYENFFASLRYL